MKHRNVLLISYHFPPMGGSGVQRATKLAKYLPACGWQTHVLCAGHSHYPLHDASLSADVPSTFIHRVPGFEPGGLAARLGKMSGLFAKNEDRVYWRLEKLCEHLPIPEPHSLWIGSAVRAARRIIREHQIDAIITTSPPHSVHLVGSRLQRQLGVPWIADLRDPILDNFGYAPRSAGQNRYWTRLEQTIVCDAHQTIVTCEDLRHRLIARYGPDVEQIRAIHNGYDPADQPVDLPPTTNTDAFTLSHVGSLYGGQSIQSVLGALRNLVQECGLAIRFRQIGAVSAAQQKHVGADDQSLVNQSGYRSHDEAIREVAAADALLLLTPKATGGKYCIPAKTFEYLAFGGHIIAVAHRSSELAYILHRAGNTTVIEDHSVPALCRAIIDCRDKWLRGQLQSPRDMDFVAHFRRDRQADSFATVLNQAVHFIPQPMIDDLNFQPCLGGAV